jgi:hypothetical protein
MEIKRHLTYANVVATLALIAAVAGGSTAIAISAKKAPKNSVTSKSIVDGAVTARDLAPTNLRAGSGSVGTAVARCLPGERVLGGGGVTDAIARSIPSGDGWIVQSKDPVTAGATAICLRATPKK